MRGAQLEPLGSQNCQKSAVPNRGLLPGTASGWPAGRPDRPAGPAGRPAGLAGLAGPAGTNFISEQTTEQLRGNKSTLKIHTDTEFAS